MRNYLSLTKPGITVFVSISAATAFIVADGFGRPALLAVAATCTMLMSAGAAALNQVIERDSDAMMQRTAGRPIPSGVITAVRAAMFGGALSCAGLLLSFALLPHLATAFLLLSHVSYVHVYTPLKRRTPYCILAGAVPGALPVLAGWAATGQAITPAAVALAGVLYMWQIPHFLAIGWLARDDYERAGFAMLGVMDTSGRLSGRVAFMFAIATLVSAAAAGITASAGLLYMSIAVVSCSMYAADALRFARAPEKQHARRLFLHSLIVLPAVLAALVVDKSVLP